MASTFTQRAINFDDWREVVFFTFVGICAVVILGLATWLVVDLATWDSEQSVSGPVTVSSQWAEFMPRKPLRPAKQ